MIVLIARRECVLCLAIDLDALGEGWRKVRRLSSSCLSSEIKHMNCNRSADLLRSGLPFQ